jgi:hypothetical protein
LRDSQEDDYDGGDVCQEDEADEEFGNESDGGEDIQKAARVRPA